MSRHPRSVTVIIPAYNEEGNIAAAIQSVVQAVATRVSDFQVLVIDDGSQDATRERALEKAKLNRNVTVVSNDQNRGFGYSYARGVKLAEKEYVTVFPGDNDMAGNSLAKLIEEMGTTDLVISYMAKNNKRSLFRRIVSKTFVILMNGLFGLHLEYFNGAFIARTQVVQSIPIKSQGLAALAECLVRLIKSGHTYKAIYFEHTGRQNEHSKAFKFKSILAVAKTIVILIKDILLSGPLSPKNVCSTSS
jgi:glycosyltransferase involved in cell wall biosynthesis